LASLLVWPQACLALLLLLQPQQRLQHRTLC
jgi:hypothetical protein